LIWLNRNIAKKPCQLRQPFAIVRPLAEQGMQMQSEASSFEEKVFQNEG
jgi:hypothetical protein